MIDIYCEAGGNVTALNQPLIATLRRTPTEDAFCECATRHDDSDEDQLEYNEESSFILYCSLTVVHCPLLVPVKRN